MKRTPIKRRTPIKQRSDKRRDLYEREGGRRDVVRLLLLERPRCEAGVPIGEMLHGQSGAWWFSCQRQSVDVHEVLTRARGGDLLDVQNLLAVCRVCHGWIHDHPHDAGLLGLLASRYGAA